MKAHHTCGVCGGTAADTPTYRVLEWMYATGETFPYFQCPRCGCLQLAEVPRDMSKYYPPDYYSHNSKSVGRAEVEMIRRRMAGKSGWRAKMILLSEGYEPFAWLSPRLCGLGSRILDVGCGDGLLLRRMRRAGFEHLTGIDPFMHDGEVGTHDGVRLLREDIFHHEGSYDLIMMHASFEHMTDPPPKVIERAIGLLAEGGRLLVSIPVCDSYAWDKLRERWAGIDAPRHIFLHTRRSMELMAAAAGARIVQGVSASSVAQFAVSTSTDGATLRLRLPGTQWRIPGTRKLRQLFYAAKTRRLDRAGRGDQVVFVLKKM